MKKRYTAKNGLSKQKLFYLAVHSVGGWRGTSQKEFSACLYCNLPLPVSCVHQYESQRYLQGMYKLDHWSTVRTITQTRYLYHITGRAVTLKKIMFAVLLPGISWTFTGISPSAAWLLLHLRTLMTRHNVYVMYVSQVKAHHLHHPWWH